MIFGKLYDKDEDCAAGSDDDDDDDDGVNDGGTCTWDDGAILGLIRDHQLAIPGLFNVMK